MRAWTFRHPNLMVVWWSLLSAYIACLLTFHIRDERYARATISLIALYAAVVRTSRWWNRT